MNWFTSYLDDRHQTVAINGTHSKKRRLACGVPQGSVLGPLLFVIYVSPLGKIFRERAMDFHMYADDNQIYVAFHPNDLDQATSTVEDCLAQVKTWMTSNMLKLNDSKTEIILVKSRYLRKHLSLPNIQIGTSIVEPTLAARNIGVVFDHHLQFDSQITAACRSIYFHLRNIARIRKYLNVAAIASLVHALITSRLDYCNALYCGLPDKLIQKLQKAQNAAARLVAGSRKTSHITPVLYQLHWLPVQYRIQYKILLLTFKALHGSAPEYIRALIRPKVSTRVLRSSNHMLLEVPPTRLKTYGDRTFSKCAPVFWNSLPSDMRQISCLETFKSQLKSQLFNTAFQNFVTPTHSQRL